MEENVKKVLLTVALIALVATTLVAESLKIAYIDTDKIMYLKTQEINPTLQTERDKWESELAGLEQEIQQLQDDYDSKKMMLLEAAKLEAEQKIQDKKNAYETRVQEIFGEQGEYYQKQAELITPILNKLQEAINKVAIENNYTMVLDAASAAIVYAKPNIDITDMVLDEMSKNIGDDGEESTTGNTSTTGGSGK